MLQFLNIVQPLLEEFKLDKILNFDMKSLILGRCQIF